jgi:hypothetical protein
VQWIFQQFIRGSYEREIASELNRRHTSTKTGRPWNGPLIGRILRNECYIGNLLYNQTSSRLRDKRVKNPPLLWVRCEGCIEPIIDHRIFLQAKKIIKERRVSLSEEEMLKRLRVTLMKKGKLSPQIINETVGLPCTAILMQRFGSLREAYRLIGYTSPRDCEYIESRKGWAAVAARLANELAVKFQEHGGQTSIDGDHLTVSGLQTSHFESLAGFMIATPGMRRTGGFSVRSCLPDGLWRSGWLHKTKKFWIICCCPLRS